MSYDDLTCYKNFDFSMDGMKVTEWNDYASKNGAE